MTPVTLSQQPRLATTQETLPYMLSMWQHTDDIPDWGNYGRAAKLREFARMEPILAGALSSMVSKACSLDWQVVGGRNRVKRYQELLAEAEDGKGWQSILTRWVQDYLNTDQGGFLELARDGQSGPVAGLYHLDAECMGFTGSVSYPLRYTPKLTNGKLDKRNGIKFAPTDFARIADMESPDESKLTLGWCAVSRAVKAARILLALYNYDEEKLADMPMPGLVTVTGLTMDELAAAFALYQAHRDDKKQAIFKGLLWLASQSSPLQPIDAKLVSFANLPENFNREETFSLYIYTLALVFGVDAREFWPATQSGATKGEAEVQAQKAKGKGFGQLLAAVERAINWNVLPDGIEFAFDRRNDDDDLAREIWRAQVYKNIRSLWEPASTGQGLITTEEARALLVESQAVPDWLAPDEDITLHSLDRTLPSAEGSDLPTPMDEEAEDQAKADEIAGQTQTQPANNSNPLSQEPGPARNAARNLTNAVQKCIRAGLDRNEDVVALSLSGREQVLWTSRKQIKVLLPNGYEARKLAAISHLQAAGLIITDGDTLTHEPIVPSVDSTTVARVYDSDMPRESLLATVKELRQAVLEALQ